MKKYSVLGRTFDDYKWAKVFAQEAFNRIKKPVHIMACAEHWQSPYVIETIR